MNLTNDMRDLVALLQRHGVAYLLVGGYAVNVHGYARATQDIDFLIRPDAENARKLALALAEFGFGKAGLPLDDFAREGLAVHLGVPPNRIDLLTSISGLSADEAFADAIVLTVDGQDVAVISLEKLIASKERSPRLRDRADAEELRRIAASR